MEVEDVVTKFFQSLVLVQTLDEAMQKFVQELRDLVPAMLRLPSEETSKKLGHNSSSRSLPQYVTSLVSMSLKLVFVGTFPDTVLTFKNIKEEGASLEVELQDSSGSRVKDGREASSKIKIFVLNGDFEVEDTDDWTDMDFAKNIALPRKDKGPLLKGKCEFNLKDGVASVGDIVFTDNSKSMRNGKFRLGARVVKGLPAGLAIRDAVSEAFKVKERRLDSYRKHKTMNVEDSTHCLKHIGQTLCQRLAYAQIHTVKDFLRLYHTDAGALKKVLHVAENKWFEIVNDAKSCLLTDEYYLYSDDGSGTVLLLDSVFNIIRVTWRDGATQLYTDLADSHKELVNGIRRVAYEKRRDLLRTHAPPDLTPTPAATVAKLTLALPHVNSSVDGSPRGQDLCRITPNQTDQVCISQYYQKLSTKGGHNSRTQILYARDAGEDEGLSSPGHTAEPELQLLMPSRSGMLVDETQHLHPQHQNSNAPPNTRSLDGAGTFLHDQLRFDNRGAQGVVRNADTPHGPMCENEFKSKRQRLI